MSVSTTKVDIINSLPGAIGFKNCDSVYTAVNQQLATLMGFSSTDAAIGKTDFEVKSDTAELAPHYINQDKVVMQTQTQQQHLDLGYYPNGEFRVHLSTKKVLQKNRLVVGTAYTCIRLQNHIVNKLFANSGRKKSAFYTIGGCYNNYSLNKRESQCLFFTMQGMSAKLIAKKLNLSTKTVEYYLHQIKNKFNCANKSTLIETAIELGFLFNIPNSMLYP
jgi:DNA-binding CsgD family transcriptional regulator